MNDTTLDTLMINVESSSKDSTDAIDSLINKLKELNKELNNVSKSSKSMSSLKTGIKANSSGARTRINNAPKPIGSAQDQLKQMGYGNLDLSKMKPDTSMRTLTTETNRYKIAAGETITVTKNLATGLDKVRVNTKNVSNETKNGANVFDLMRSSIGGTIVKLQYVTNILRSIVPGLGRAYKAAAGYTEALNLFTVTMGDYAEKGLEWVEKFSDALYLDPTNVMQYMGSFNSLIKGLGTGSDRAYLMSKNLTQLTYDLASFKNLDFETAYQKLMSGISGELEPLRNTGVALSQVTLQQLAYSLGIQQNIQDMNEAQKAQLRYIQIMRSSTEWQTDMGRTLMSPANALRVIQQQFLLLAKAIGNVFIPIVMSVIPYVMVLTKWLTVLANKIAAFFGYKIKDTGGVASASTYQTMSNGLGSVGKAADATNKKLHTTLAAFDDLNVVQSKSESGGAGSGAGGAGAGDLPVDLPEYDALANLTDKFKDKMKDAEKTLKRMLPIVEAIAAAFALWKISKSVLKFLSLLGGSGGAAVGLKTFKDLLGKGGLSLGTFGLAAAGVVSTIIAWVKELPKLSKGFEDVVFKGKKISEVTSEFSALDKVLLGILGFNNPVGMIGVFVNGIKDAFKGLKKPAIESGNILDELGDKISKTSKKKLTPLIKEFEDLNGALISINLSDMITDADISNVDGKLQAIVGTITKELDVDKNNTLKNLKTIEKSLGTDNYNEILKSTEDFYNGQRTKVEEGRNRISEILETAKNRDGKLTQTEANEINSIREEMYSTGIKAATENSDEYYAIMGRLKQNLGKLSIEQASEYIQNAINTRDKTIKAAEEQYDKVLAEAGRLRDVGAISDDEYTQMTEAAEKTRDETIAAATKQYDEIYNTIDKKMGASMRVIDTDTGKIKSNWQVFTDDLKVKAKNAWSSITQGVSDFGKGFSKGWNNVMEGAKTIVKDKLNDLKSRFENFRANIKMPHIRWESDGTKTSGLLRKALETLNLPTSLPKIKVDWYAEGGFPDSASLFYANENGVPEMVGRIGGRTAVANNDQITTSITNALLTALNNYDFGGSKSPTTIYIGNKKVYEGMGDYSKTENDRYGTNMIRV